LSVCHPDILTSLDPLLLAYLRLGACVAILGEEKTVTRFWLKTAFLSFERLAKSLVRSLASPFDYARVPSCEGTGSPLWVVLQLTVIQSRSRFGARLPILGFRVATLVSPAGIPDSPHQSRCRDPFS
jgi:hypothetical protein